MKSNIREWLEAIAMLAGYGAITGIFTGLVLAAWFHIFWN